MAGVDITKDTGLLAKQLHDMQVKQNAAVQNVSKNEAEAQKIQEQVAKTTNDEDILNRQVVAATDEQNRNLKAAFDNHDGALRELNAKREGLKEPTEPKKPADDADEAVKKEYADKKSQYEADMKAYKEQSAILDDAFKAENKRYEEELKKIEEAAKEDKQKAEDAIKEAQRQIKELRSQGEDKALEIETLRQNIQDSMDAIKAKEQEIADAKTAQTKEKERQEKEGGVDGNKATDPKAEKADAKADKKALKAFTKDLKLDKDAKNITVDKDKGVVTYEDKDGKKHTVTVSGTGKGSDAQYKVADNFKSEGVSDTKIFDMGFKNGKADFKHSGSVETNVFGSKITSFNSDGTTTISEKREGKGVTLETSTIKAGDMTSSAEVRSNKTPGGGDMKTTTTTYGGNGIEKTSQKSSVITNKDGSTTKIDYSSIDNSRTEVTEKDGKATNVTSYNNDKSKTSVNYRGDGATTMVNYNTEGKETNGLISRTDGEKTYDQGVTYKNDKAYTTTNVKFSETIDNVLERMGITKKEYGEEVYNAIKTDFLAENKTKTRNGKQYFLAGQEVKVPVDLDKYKPTEQSTTAVDGKAEEGKWKQWFDGRASRRH